MPERLGCDSRAPWGLVGEGTGTLRPHLGLEAVESGVTAFCAMAGQSQQHSSGFTGIGGSFVERTFPLLLFIDFGLVLGEVGHS